MSKAYCVNKSWVELMEEELEAEGLSSEEEEELEDENVKRRRLQNNKEILKEEDQKFLVKEEKLEVKKESVGTRGVVIANEEHKVNNKHLLGISDDCKNYLKEESSLPAIKVEVENRKERTSNMNKEYCGNKSWVELMEEEAEAEGRSSEEEELEDENVEKGRLQNNKEILKEEDQKLLVKEEKFAIKKESLGSRDVAIANEEQNVDNKHLLGISEECKNYIKEETSLPATRVKVENESCSSLAVPSTGSDKPKANQSVVNHLIRKEKIKTEPDTHPACDEDFSAVSDGKEIPVTSIKIKSEVEDIDDDDRLSKELENIEHDLAQGSNKPREPLDDSMRSVSNDSKSHTFVHPGAVASGEYRTLECAKNKTNVSSSAQSSPRRNRNRKRKSSSDLGKNNRKYSCRDQSASSSSSSHGSSAGDNKSTPRKGKKKVEYETDPEVLARRQKQIDYGKNTIGYDRYRQLVPKDMRGKRDPRTPPKQIKYSRRAWDGIVKIWRQQLHLWDPVSDDKDAKALPELNVSVDVTTSPYKRRIHTNTVSSTSGSGSTEDVASDDFLSLDCDYADLQ